MGYSEEPNLTKIIKKISGKCIKCDKCFDECAFIRKYGKPGEIAESCNPQDINSLKIAFECSLCGLCEAVCPVKLDLVSLFLEMRREAVKKKKRILKSYSGLIAYEKIGVSKRYSWYGLPEGCDTIFFPGCTLSGTRPETTFKLYRHLKKIIPNIGIVLDCCIKPSHDLGRFEYFNAMFGEMKTWFRDHGIKQVYAACPNCYRVFKDYGKEFSVNTVYEFLADRPPFQKSKIAGNATVHDPCVIRQEKEIHAGARELIRQAGLRITEMPHSGITTLCCGEGGAVRNQSPDLAENWTRIRKYENKGQRIITYCAGCANQLSSAMPSSHILDLLFNPEEVMKGKEKVSKPPFTYWNRLRLKKRLKKEKNIPVSMEREYFAK